MSPNTRRSRIVLNRKAVMRIGLFAAFVLVLSLLLPTSYKVEYSFEAGRPWTGPDLVAAFDFPILKSEEELKEERERVKSEIHWVFSFNALAEEEAVKAVERTCDSMEALMGLSHAERQLHPGWPKLAGTDFPKTAREVSQFRSKVEELLRQFYALGVIDKAPEDIPGEWISLRKSTSEEVRVDKQSVIFLRSWRGLKEKTDGMLSPQEQELFSVAVFPQCKPNYLFHAGLTEKEKQLTYGSISQVKELRKAQSVLIQNGEEVSMETAQVLRSYFFERQMRFGRNRFWPSFMGHIGMVGLVAILLALFLRNNRPRIFYRNRKLAIILLVMLIMMLLSVLALKFSLRAGNLFDVNYIYLVPACMVPIMLTAFFDLRVGFFTNILMSILIGGLISNGFEYFFVQFCAGTVSVYSLTRLRNRGDFFIALMFIFAGYVVSFLVYNFFAVGGLASISYQNLVLFGMNVLLTFITYPLIWVFEKVFRITSDLTFIELLDTNHPLLKELFNRAPGTFHHSLQVSNISEAVISRIGGNSLLVKVGALFHDIGKMENPRYFIENQSEGMNPHEKLSFEQSAEIIIRHVPDGVRLAARHNLPREVIDFIRTHHGTSRVEFFFRKYSLEHQGKEVDEGRFRYPGPIPFTRETAVVMIVDSIEAACRAMTSRSREDLQNLIDKIIEHKISLRQFDSANITFKDLHDIREVILEQLMNIYHERVAYPD